VLVERETAQDEVGQHEEAADHIEEHEGDEIDEHAVPPEDGMKVQRRLEENNVVLYGISSRFVG